MPLLCKLGRLSFQLIQENRRACLYLQCTPWINKELINFLIETIVGNDDSDDEAAGAAAAAPAHCKVSEQKETVNGLVDGECGDQAPAGYAGLCRLVCYCCCCCCCLFVPFYCSDDLRNRSPLETRRGVSTKFYTGRSNSLHFYIPFFTEKVPLSYTFY